MSARRLMGLFAGHPGVHGTHGEPDLSSNGLKWEIKRTARTKREPVTEALWVDHLAGNYPLGIVPIREDGTCSWGSIDVDEYDIDLLETVRKVEAARIPLVPCRSKSGGLHLFLFTTEPVPAELMLGILKDLAARLGHAGCEIFPKQVEVLSDRGDLGNWMVMPYFGSTYNGKLRDQVGLKKTGAEQTLSEFLDLAEASKQTPGQLQELGRTRASNSERNGEFADGPCCLQHLSRGGFPEGGRNNALFMIGIYIKKKHASDWRDRVAEYNQRFMRPPLSPEEINGVIRQLGKKDYEYTCRNEPMASHCDSSTCRGRRYGVGDADSFPVITDIRMLESEPTLWFITIDGRTVEASTDQLLNFPLFQKLVAERLRGRIFRHMTPAAWTGALAEPMSRVTVMEAPPADMSVGAEFREMLEEFLTNRGRGERREDLLLGRPWEDEETERHFFRLGDLIKFLKREGLRDITRPQLVVKVQALGGDKHIFNIRGKTTNVWWVPSSVAQAPDEDEVPRPVREAPI